MSWCCGFALWLSGWLVTVLGKYLTQSRVLCKGVDGDSLEHSAKLLLFRLIWDAHDRLICGMCRGVEIRACDRVATGVAWEAVGVKGMVCSLRPDSAQHVGRCVGRGSHQRRVGEVCGPERRMYMLEWQLHARGLGGLGPWVRCVGI